MASSSFSLSLSSSLSVLHDRSAGKKRRKKKDLLSLPFSPELAAEGSEGEEKEEREREREREATGDRGGGPFYGKKGDFTLKASSPLGSY